MTDWQQILRDKFSGEGILENGLGDVRESYRDHDYDGQPIARLGKPKEIKAGFVNADKIWAEPPARVDTLPEPPAEETEPDSMLAKPADGEHKRLEELGTFDEAVVADRPGPDFIPHTEEPEEITPAVGKEGGDAVVVEPSPEAVAEAKEATGKSPTAPGQELPGWEQAFATGAKPTALVLPGEKIEDEADVLTPHPDAKVKPKGDQVEVQDLDQTPPPAVASAVKPIGRTRERPNPTVNRVLLKSGEVTPAADIIRKEPAVPLPIIRQAESSPASDGQEQPTEKPNRILSFFGIRPKKK